MVIMPALFIFTCVGENKMIHRMEEVAGETHHELHTVEWADRVHRASPEDIKLHDLYRQSVLNSNVRLVDGELQLHHKAANYVQANPFKMIAGVGVPAVAAIFYGQGGQGQQLQLRILHTRVIGQFAVICTLLGVMGMKEMMDHQGRYITDEDIESRVQEMQATRDKMMSRLDYQNSLKPHKPVEKKREDDHHHGDAVAHA
jgi:hypothetical protein